MPGETAAPGTASGKTGAPNAQTAGSSFNVTVNAVDANWNPVSSTDTVGITSTDANATLPANTALVAGTKTLSVTAKTAGSKTFTATDITNGAMTANTSPATTINAGAFAKLQLLMPGETAAPGTASGKTGAPSAQTAGSSFNVTVNAVDANWNPVTSTDTIGITSTDPNATLPANAALVAGTKTFSITPKTASTPTFTATDITNGTMTANTSPATTVNGGAFAKLQILLPGETAAPGTASGKTGTPSAQTAGGSFNVTVNAVDANWNPVSATDVVGITSSDANAGLPANSALVAGTKTFAVTAKTAGSATFTSTDITNGTMTANTSPATTINAGAFAKLQLLMPGETAAPGTASGKTGTPSAQTAAASFTVTVNAVDANWNPVSATDTVALSTSDANATPPAPAALVAGTKTFSVILKTAGSSTVTATDQSNGSMTANTSPATTVNGGAFAKLQILLPGETAAPGTASGKTGAPSAQTAGTAFNVTVNAVDANWNPVSSTDTVGITSSDANAALPANAALVAGTKTFSVTPKTGGTATFTSTDVTNGAMTANTSPAATINAGAFAKLQILLPGETAAPGTASGKTGTPRAQTAGSSFNVTVNAVDANWNLVTATDTIAITSSDPNAALPANAALVAGTKAFAVTPKTQGTATFTATDSSDGTKTANTSPSTTINAGAFAKLQILLPGETAAPGTPSGKTGTPTAEAAGSAFTATVNAVDANWNPVSSTDTVAITSSDSNATLPANAALVAGTKTFSITPRTTGSATFTATDASDGTKTANTSTSATINTGGFAKLQILLPGETAAPGTPSGKTGAPVAQTAGSSFNVTVNAVDSDWNPVTATDTIAITSSDANATLPANAALVAGTKTFSVTAKTAGTATFTATDATDGLKTANTSPATTINAGAFAKLLILLPGETAAPGTASGKTGAPSAQTAGSSFNVTVVAVDANWNPVNSTDTVGITSTDPNASAAEQRRARRRHEDILGHTEDSVGAHLHGDGHHQRHDDREHEPGHDGQSRRLREAPAADARRDRRPRHRVRQDRRAERSDRGRLVHRHRQRRRRQLEPRQLHGRRRHHLERRQRDAARQRRARRGHEDLLGHSEDGRQRDLHRVRHQQRLDGGEHEPGDGDQHRRVLEAADPDARRDRRTGQRIRQDRRSLGSDRGRRLHRHRQRRRRELERRQLDRHRRDHLHRRQRDAAGQRRTRHGHQDLLRDSEDGRIEDLHRDGHHERRDDGEHEPRDDDQRRCVHEAPDPDARRDRRTRHRLRQDRRPVGPDRGRRLHRHRERGRRELERRQLDRHRRHHLHRRQRDAARERGARRRHQDVLDHAEDCRFVDVHGIRHLERRDDCEYEPGDDDQRRRVREAADPDAG